MQKVQSNTVLARHKNFVEQISIKFEGFLRNQDEFSTNLAVDKHSKISVQIRISADIQKVKYRWTAVGLYIKYIQLYHIVELKLNHAKKFKTVPGHRNSVRATLSVEVRIRLHKESKKTAVWSVTTFWCMDA